MAVRAKAANTPTATAARLRSKARRPQNSSKITPINVQPLTAPQIQPSDSNNFVRPAGRSSTASISGCKLAPPFMIAVLGNKAWKDGDANRQVAA